MSSVLDFLPEVTIEISQDITAFSREDAEAATRKFQHPRYWEDLEVDSRWWIIGESSSGDHWLIRPDSGVWFFDSNFGERAAHLFTSLGISVTEWLVLAHALRQFEHIPYPTDDDAARLDALVSSISPDLAERYPFDLPFL